MFIVDSYALAIALCVVTMLCWGSWGNTQKLAGKAGASISYALGQGAPMIAALWGVFIWKEFKGSNSTVNALLALMFVLFITGLGMIVAAGN